MQVIVAATPSTTGAATDALLQAGAIDVDATRPSPGRVLVRGGPFTEAEAAAVVAGLRGVGWPASDRPEGGGHLTAWHTHTAPVAVGDRLWVCFPWSEHRRPSRRVVVEIDPGGAFGSGGHPSTRLLLGELEARLVGGETVLDVGCGSGVLAIAAVRLGAGAAIGVDLAPAAVEATHRNAAANDVAEQVSASTTVVEDVVGCFDVVLANIGVGILRQLGPTLARLVTPGGWLAVSGISQAQVSLVGSALPGLTVMAVPQLDDWVALVAAKGAPA